MDQRIILFSFTSLTKRIRLLSIKLNISKIYFFLKKCTSFSKIITRDIHSFNRYSFWGSISVCQWFFKFESYCSKIASQCKGDCFVSTMGHFCINRSTTDYKLSQNLWNSWNVLKCIFLIFSYFEYLIKKKLDYAFPLSFNIYMKWKLDYSFFVKCILNVF